MYVCDAKDLWTRLWEMEKLKKKTYSRGDYDTN